MAMERANGWKLVGLYQFQQVLAGPIKKRILSIAWMDISIYSNNYI